MRINRYLAQATGISRRQADKYIEMRKVRIGQQVAKLGDHVTNRDEVYLENRLLHLPEEPLSIALHKPIGYVCSRRGQGSKTIYDLLPTELKELKPVGRLDKDSSGLLIMTNDGQMAHELMHPKFAKTKVYQVILNQPLEDTDKENLTKGVQLTDGPSHLQVTNIISSQQKHLGLMRRIPDSELTVSLTEGRNRQIRRTFSKLGYKVLGLHRTKFGDYAIGNLRSGKYRSV